MLLFESKHVDQIACGMRHSLVLIKGKTGQILHFLNLIISTEVLLSENVVCFIFVVIYIIGQTLMVLSFSIIV